MAICEQERVGQSGVHPQETAKQNTGGRLTRDRCSDGGSTALFEAEGAKMRSKNSIGESDYAAASRHGSKRRRDGSETNVVQRGREQEGICWTVQRSKELNKGGRRR